MKSLTEALSTSFTNEGRFSREYDDNEPEGKLAAYIYDAGVGYLNSDDVEYLLSSYPNKKKVLAYRGLFFKSAEGYKKFIENIKSNKLEFNSYSSWTRSKSTAEQFALTKPTNNIMLLGREFFKAEDERRKVKDYTQGYGIIIETIIRPNQGIDVNSIPHIGQEDEIILSKGTYTIKVIKTFKPHRSGVKDIKDLNVYIQKQRQIKSGFGQSMEYSMLEHILANYEDLLTDKSRRHLYYMFSGELNSCSWKYKTVNMDRYEAISAIGKTISAYGREEIKDDEYLGGKKQKKTSIYLDGFNNNLFIYYDLLLPKHQSIVTNVIETKCFELIETLENLHSDISRTHFFEIYTYNGFKKFLNSNITTKLNGLLNKSVGTLYHELNSRESINKINSLSGQDQQDAINDMVDDFKKLFKNIN